jgi:AcrR family transcriptional regulator
MVQNTSPSSQRLGRRPGFDSEAVVAAAIVAFWAKGFEATTLSDLEAATGVDRSSIYNSFGGKEGLYRSAAAARKAASSSTTWQRPSTIQPPTGISRAWKTGWAPPSNELPEPERPTGP